MKNSSILIILFSIIVSIITIFFFLTQSSQKPYFLTYSQEKADRLATIIEEFYENKAQRSFYSNMDKFIRSLSPYTLEAILTKNITNASFYSKLESIGQLNIWFDKYDQNQYASNKIKNIFIINDKLQEWLLDNDQSVLTYQQALLSDNLNIGTIYLVFSESNITPDELKVLKDYSDVFSSPGDIIQSLLDKKNIHFMYLILIPALTLLLLFLSYREIRKRDHLRQFSPQVNIVILTIFSGIVLIVYFCIGPPAIQHQDERWYAEKMLEKAMQQRKYGKEQLSKDYFQDIEKKHLPEHKQKDYSILQGA